VALAACSSKKSSTPAPKKDAGIDSGVDSGRADSGSTPATDSGTAATMITCGTKSCTAPMVNLPDGGIGGLVITPDQLAMVVSPMVCCSGASKDVCGVTQSTVIPDGTCVEQMQKGAPNAVCPAQSVTVMGLAVPLKGCCKPSNKCGVDVGILGVGCLERTEFSKIGMMAAVADGGMPLPALQVITCDYTAGSTDAGPGGSDSGSDAN
jgi:hypothetical protein